MKRLSPGGVTHSIVLPIVIRINTYTRNLLNYITSYIKSQHNLVFVAAVMEKNVSILL